MVHEPNQPAEKPLVYCQDPPILGIVRGGLPMRLALITTSVLLSFATSACGATYYVAANGSDANNGTSKGTPFAHAPGMAACINICASTSPVAGDSIIFKGGDTWTNPSFTWTISWSGTPGNSIYFGVDKTWYSGGSWVRPVFDMQSTSAGAKNIIINLNSSPSYVTIDNFEIVNFRWTGSPAYGTTIGVSLGVSTNVLLENLYMHAWTHDNPGCTSGNCDAFKFINGSTSLNGNAGVVISGVTCDGFPSGTDSGECTYAVPTVENSTARNMSNGFLLNGTTVMISGNTVGPINPSYDSGNHENCIETTGAQTVYLSDNVIHDCTAVTVFVGGGSSTAETDYIWNNVIYNSVPVPIIIDTQPVAAGSAYLYNNTLVATGPSSCTRITQRGNGNLKTFVAENNLCISDNSSASQAEVCDNTWSSTACAGANTETLKTNVVMSHAGATSDGFTSSNAYAETATTNSTYQAATNLTSICSGALATLCTSFNVLAEPTSGPWDAGAYRLMLTILPPINVLVSTQ
jgi:hypothetical protein